MKWYTQDNGVLCLGTEEQQSVNFHVATDVVTKTKINTTLSESHIELIGSFTEPLVEMLGLYLARQVAHLGEKLL